MRNNQMPSMEEMSMVLEEAKAICGKEAHKAVTSIVMSAVLAVTCSHLVHKLLTAHTMTTNELFDEVTGMSLVCASVGYHAKEINSKFAGINATKEDSNDQI
jgi:hypothetical protein